MFKILNGLLVSTVVFFSMPLAAKTITLAPNESKMLANNAPFALNANCNVHSSHPVKSKIRIVVLKNKGIINGRNLASGQGTSVTVKNDTSISVSADSGTQINLTNLSTAHLQAVCAL